MVLGPTRLDGESLTRVDDEMGVSITGIDLLKAASYALATGAFSDIL